MAHKTRKRLTKAELKKDPVNDALLKGINFFQTHLKLLVILLIVFTGLIIVGKSFISKSAEQNDICTANLYFAQQVYTSSISTAQNGQYEQAFNELNTAYSIAMNNYERFPGKEAGKQSLILASMIGIILGNEASVISDLDDFLATNPGDDITNSASIYLAIALENRGGDVDLTNAQNLLIEILDREPGNQLRWEAFSALSRIAYHLEDYDRAGAMLDSALTIFPDTTDFINYQLTRLAFE